MRFDSHGPTEICGTRSLAGPRRDATCVQHRLKPLGRAFDAEDLVLVLGLGLISCSAALLLVNGGWSF
ncbi:MAG: hypothetical protein WAN86_18120 [Hyphomicrobiaceae bacterium]